MGGIVSVVVGMHEERGLLGGECCLGEDRWRGDAICLCGLYLSDIERIGCCEEGRRVDGGTLLVGSARGRGICVLLWRHWGGGNEEILNHSLVLLALIAKVVVPACALFRMPGRVYHLAPAKASGRCAGCGSVTWLGIVVLPLRNGGGR